MLTLLALALAATPVLMPSEAGLGSPSPVSHALEAQPSLGSVQSLEVAPAPEAVDGTCARIAQLRREVAHLNVRIRGIDTHYPLSALLMLYGGYTLAPLALVGIPLTLYGALAAPAGAVGLWLATGVAGIVLGGIGVALLVAGIITGSEAVRAARAERDSLVQQRIQREAALRELEQRRGAADALTIRLLRF